MAAQRVQLFQISDFSGGLNFRDDAFTMRPNELADSVNVRILPQGGCERRKTLVANANNGVLFAETLRNIWAFYGNGVQQIMLQDGNDAWYGTGGAFTAINPDALVTAGIMRAATMSRIGTVSSDRCYIQRNAEQVAWKWNGSAATILADASAAYNDNVASPSGGRMPIARYICSHGGFMFHAYTVEGAVTKQFRLRWSHPGEPEDYRTNDFVDVGADDGDPITGISPLGRSLIIFKNRSVWVLSGFTPDTFQLQKISSTVGAVGQEAITHTESHVYFFDSISGVYSLDAHGSLQWLWAKLAPRLTDSTIPPAYVSGTTLGWMDNRLWVAVPWGTSTTNTHCFVYDPLVGKEPAWYLYTYPCSRTFSQTLLLQIGPMLEYRPTGGAVQELAIIGSTADAPTHPLVQTVARLEVDNSAEDTMPAQSGSTLTVGNGLFESYIRTAWFAAGLPGVRKRWRRPTFILDADHAAMIGLEIFTNYVNATPARTQSLTVTPAGNSGGGGVWGTHNWGDGTLWGPSANGEQAIVRGGAFGSAYAVQLKLDVGPGSNAWGLNGVDMRFIPQRIR